LGEAGDLVDAVQEEPIADRVLHPCVGDDDEETRDPRTGEDEHGREPMETARQTLFAEQEEAKKG
jgi:hypothetical protein